MEIFSLDYKQQQSSIYACIWKLVLTLCYGIYNY